MMTFNMKVTEHPRLHRDWIHPHALHIVEALQSRNYITYLVGGCVRDLIVGIPPKDFDIATAARPNQVKRVVSNAYVIGRRFRLVLVKDGDEQFEVATFRRSPTVQEEADEMLDGDNLFGTPEQDAKRRDFTCNGLFYDPVGDQVIDHCEGMVDINDRILRMIGIPEDRLVEDPIRILRALRLATKLNFIIEETLRNAMQKCSYHLTRSVLPRRREEMLKILRLKEPAIVMYESLDLEILDHAFPSLARIFAQPEQAHIFEIYFARLRATEGTNPTPVDLFLMLILPFVRCRIQSDLDVPISGNQLADNDELRTLMRDELGMFNLEQSMILAAIQTQDQLREVDDFQRRGRRRRNGFLRQEHFPLSLRIAAAEMTITPQQLAQWEAYYAEFQLAPPQGPSSNETSRSGRTRTSDNGKRASNTTSESPESEDSEFGDEDGDGDSEISVSDKPAL